MPKHKKILAIDPGTREMGIALLEGDRLIYHGVKVIRNRPSPHEILKQGREIVVRLIQDFRPDILIYEKTFFANNRNSALVNVLVDEIKAIGKRKRLRVVGYAANTVKKFICGNGRASKKEVARAVIGRFPELAAYLDQDRKWKERYHMNMFDAVALALTQLFRK
jgi:crossover junction endodeoxyribonuclease RuvC